MALPLACGALGLGFAAQAVLRPVPPAEEGILLEALTRQAPSPPGEARVAHRAPGAPVAARRTPGPGGVPALTEPAAGPPLPLEIRVALLQLSPSPSLGARGAWRLLDRSGRTLAAGGAGQAVPLEQALAGRQEVQLVAAPGAALLADGRAYGGQFRILRQGSGVLVVNHLPLEEYVSAVVGGEMPSGWNLEALRAQAVAARSYALAHMARPSNAHWHLGDTTRWQHYTGLGAVDARTLQATRSTAGLILSYRGGIVESLYAATAQIAQEAHGHLGASMSQHGAQELAEQGLSYNAILGHFYRGAALARLTRAAQTRAAQ